MYFFVCLVLTLQIKMYKDFYLNKINLKYKWKHKKKIDLRLLPVEYKMAYTSPQQGVIWWLNIPGLEPDGLGLKPR